MRHHGRQHRIGERHAVGLRARRFGQSDQRGGAGAIDHLERRTRRIGHDDDDVAFGAASDEILFPRSAGQARILGADPYLNRMLLSYCEEALARHTLRGSFRHEVMNTLAPLLPHGKATAGEAARRLAVSQRTLARRLAHEGVTFSDLLDQLRSDLASRYLAADDLPISQIAWLLGFREASAFSHAFKRWTGMTPRAARQRGAGSSLPAQRGGWPAAGRRVGSFREAQRRSGLPT